MRNIYPLAGLLGLLASPLASAQSLTETRYGVTTANVYAQQQINLLPDPNSNVSFEASSGFEALIKLPEDVAGRWSAPQRWTDYERGGPGTGITGMVGIHTHVLPNGKVFSWEGHNSNTFALPSASCTSHAYSWNPNPSAKDGSRAYPFLYDHYDLNNINIFCGGHTFLANGRLLSAGGHYSAGEVDRGNPISTTTPVNNDNNLDYIPPSSTYPDFSIPNLNGYIGIRDLNIYDYKTPLNTPGNGWLASAANEVSAMTYRRWYPTATTLADGRVLVTAGQRYGGPLGSNTTVQAEIPEVYTPATNAPDSWQALTGAARRLPLYPWMFQAPDGRVFNAGPNRQTGFLNPTAAAIATTPAGAWQDGPLHVLGASSPLPAGTGVYEYSERGAGTAVMYRPGQIMIAGGGGPTGVTNKIELIDLNDASPAWLSTADMHMAFPRGNLNSTLLADGTVLLSGGSQRPTTNDADGVLAAELWTPPTAANPGGTWATMNAMTVPRLYHSAAVLLPDATVLSLGGGQGGTYTTHSDYEIFTPPYLCKGLPRPEISSVPQAVAYGQTFTVGTPQASSIWSRGGRVTLVRLSSVTHAFNMNQRFLELRPLLATSSSNSVSVAAPSDPNVCPPGHYMLFVIDNNGTPSHASIIAINATACATSLSIAQSSPNPANSFDSCSQTTIFTASGGPAGSTYVWTVNGNVYGTTGSSTSISVVTTLAAPTAQVTVALAGSAGCGATSAVTSYFPGCVP